MIGPVAGVCERLPQTTPKQVCWCHQITRPPQQELSVVCRTLPVRYRIGRSNRRRSTTDAPWQDRSQQAFPARDPLPSPTEPAPAPPAAQRFELREPSFMSFLWPDALLGYLVVPMVVAGYVWSVRQPARARIHFPGVDLAARAAGAGSPVHRHIPAGLYLSTLCGVIFALARPVAPLPLPDNRPTVILSVDTSSSMAARDVVPSRIEAATQAAARLVRGLPRGAKVGLVTFSTDAHLIVPPTEDRDRVIQALQGLRPEGATAIGDGILEALVALPGRHRSMLAVRPADPHPTAAEAAGMLPGVVVLMSDGGNNAGTPPEQAARVARRLRVVVHTVGLGAPPSPDTQAGVEPLDEATLARVAALTGGAYRRASSAVELTQAYTRLGRAIGWARRPVELSGVMSAMTAVLLVGALTVSLLRDPLG